MERSLCDLLVIGSGFGGAVCALRAAEAGLRMRMLERGRRLTPEIYEDMAVGRAPILYGDGAAGPLELHRLKGLLALTASAVGGGSNVYTAVTIRPPAEVFDDGWPAGVNSEALAPYYDQVEAMIAPTPIPHALPRTAALETIGGLSDTEVTRLPLSMDWPQDLQALNEPTPTNGMTHEVVTWLQGGRAARKRTLVHTYLARAEAHGAQVCPLHEATALRPDRGGYRVTFRRFGENAWHDDSTWAPRVILATGTLATVRLLLKCRDELQTLPDLSGALGQSFFTNGDSGGLLVRPRIDLAPDAGPPVTAWMDLWKRDRLYLMETGLVPFDFGSFAGLLNPASWGNLMRPSPVKKCTWSFGVMGYSDNPGQLVLSRRGVLVHRHDAKRGTAFHARSRAALRDLADAAGAKLKVPPKMLTKHLPVTVHPLGGASMADSPDAGMTSPIGEVFGYPGLFVADGSLVPKPTGVPPSMTIAALAERNIEHVIKPC